MLEVARGRVGAIFVQGPLRATGYTNGTLEEQGDGSIRTGDRGYIDADGRLFVIGREDDMIVSGGENVFPREVEDVLLQHQDVLDAAVVGAPDAEFGQRLRAYVVGRPSTQLTAPGLTAFIRRHVERYKVPRDFVFVPELPRNATGTLQRRSL